MAAIDTVRELMHGERRMCSVCEIAKETSIDPEVVKVLMVDIANETVWHPVAAPRRKSKLYSDADEQTLRKLWYDGITGRKIAKEMGRSYGSVAHKIHCMQHAGMLPRRKRKNGGLKWH